MDDLDVKNREEKEREMARGSYEAVGDSQSRPKYGVSGGQRLWKLVPMAGLLFGAGTMIVLHHFFNAHLNGKRIDPGTNELPSSFKNQRNVNNIGTAIAHGVRIFLSLAVGSTFAQLLWETLRRRSFTITQFDAVVSCGQSPFRPSALRAASASFALFLVSLVASVTSLVVILTPGSLTVDSEFPRNVPCTVPTVPSEVSGPHYNSMAGGFNFSLSNVVTAVRDLNEYFPPYQTDASSTCGEETTSCSYNLTFAGPAFDCVDITSETNFTSFLIPPFSDNPPFQAFTLWDTNTPYEGSGVGLIILSRDLEKGVLQANNCTTYNATYDVGVSLHSGPATVEVWDVTLISALSSDQCVTNDIALNAVDALGSSCQAQQENTAIDCQWGSFFVTTLSGNFTFSEPVPLFVTTFLQNITLSLLSGNIFYGFGNDTASNLQYIQSTCTSIVTAYVYNPTRLLATYGVTIAVSALVTAYGCYLILRNDVERDLLLSQLTDVVLNDAALLFDKDFKKIGHGSTRIQLFRIDHTRQKLVLAPQKTNGPSVTPVNTGARAFLPALATHRAKMSLLVLSAVVCMVLNHAYYRYLNGKPPNSSLHHLPNSSSWLLNQTIVSDIGIALAYIGQTLFAVAIGASSTQLFWRNMRYRGHAIDEVDSLMKAQRSPFSVSLLRALRASRGMSLLALLVASTSLISIFAPGAVKVASDHNEVKDCTVMTFQNLSTLSVNASLYGSRGGNTVFVKSMASSGTYLSPVNMCGTDPSTSNCSYDLELVGPGFDCEYVTQPNNNTAFATSLGPNTTFLYLGELPAQVNTDLWQMFFQSWDIERSIYQNVTCTGVLRSYAVSISHETNSAISVTESRILSEVQGNMAQATAFAELYLTDILTAVGASLEGSPPWFFNNVFFILAQPGGIGTIEPDGNITWNQNMPLALEEFAQNATLSLLSGQIFTMNPDAPDGLENVTTKCSYTFTAYEYSPLRLFLTYGIGLFVTILCVFAGVIAIRRNGVEESMDFSRFLRAILNERIYNARDSLDKDTVVKADNTAEGLIAPVDS